jgi:hypothetical protein
VPFVLVRAEPVRGPEYLYHKRIVEFLYTWTLYVLTTEGERAEVWMQAGTCLSRRSNEAPRTRTHNKFTIDRMLAAADIYIEGMARLAVMLDKLMSEDDLRNAAPKARKLREAAAMALRCRRVQAQYSGEIFSIVAGDAVLVVARQFAPGNPSLGRAEKVWWNELAFRVGERCVYDSYNLAYTGRITSISPKTITVVDGDTTKRLPHEVFARRNTRPIEAADKRNADWMD